MSPEETLKQIKNWSPSLVQDVIDQLNQTGIVSDEDDQGFASIWIKHWDGACTDYFRRTIRTPTRTELNNQSCENAPVPSCL